MDLGLLVFGLIVLTEGLYFAWPPFVLSQSVSSVLRIQGSERGARPAGVRVARRSRRNGAAR